MPGQTELAQFISGSRHLKYDTVNTYYVQFLAIGLHRFRHFLEAGVRGNTGEDCSRLRPASVIRPLISGRVMFGPLCAFRAVEGDL